MTPLPAREPYNAEAAPPFSTVIFSISSEFRSLNPFPISGSAFQKSLFFEPAKLDIGTPSTTISGWLSFVRELNPLKMILDEPEGPVEDFTN